MDNSFFLLCISGRMVCVCVGGGIKRAAAAVDEV